MKGYRQMNEKELVNELIEAGLKVEKTLVEETCSRGQKIVPLLKKTIEEDEFWEHNKPGDGWAPYHTIHILPKIKTKESLAIIIDALYEREEELGDWITEDMPSILAEYGPIAVAELKKIIKDEELDIFIRSAASQALTAIARKNPETKKEITEFITGVIKQEKDTALLTFLVDDAAQLKDQGLLEYTEKLFENNKVDETITGIDFIKQTFSMNDKELDSRYNIKNPLAHFANQHLAYLWGITHKNRPFNFNGGFPDKKYRVQPQKQVATQKKKKKIGRNQPCPCGSGKKYKKCCLGKEKEPEKVAEIYEEQNTDKINEALVQLKISLNEIKPEIWRRIFVKNTVSFQELHNIIQKAMGWENYHMFEFCVGNATITVDEEGYNLAEASFRKLHNSPEFKKMLEARDFENNNGILDTDKVNAIIKKEEEKESNLQYNTETKIGELIEKPGQKMLYTYDFGDNWRHTIVVEKIIKDCSQQHSVCIAGGRACPPEDCGGTTGYAEILEALKDKENPKYKERLEWLGNRFDPEYFDVAKANRNL